MTLLLEKGAIAIFTDSQMASFMSVTVGKDAVLVTVPDDTSADERIAILLDKLKQSL